MSQVQVLSWKTFLAQTPSYRDLKTDCDNQKNILDQLLNKFSMLKPDEAVKCRDEILSGKGVMIPTANLDRAEELAVALEAVGAKVRVRELDNACQCEHCKTFTVIKIKEEPKGFDIYCCQKCHELKRACPECGGQGWLRHYRACQADGSTQDEYSCDECSCCFDQNWNQKGWNTNFPYKSAELVGDFL